MKYQGSLVEPIGGRTSDIQSKIASATGVFHQPNHSLWNQKKPFEDDDKNISGPRPICYTKWL
jgi:hypothetical protein